MSRVGGFSALNSLSMQVCIFQLSLWHEKIKFWVSALYVAGVKKV